MATKIEWTNETWNPITGCSRVSEGCRNCYAERFAHRFSGKGQRYEHLTQITNGRPTWTGNILFSEDALLKPIRWRKPRRVFVNSMSDLFHPAVTDEQIDQIFAIMALCPRHTFQILTKRPERMLKYLTRFRTKEQWADHLSALDGNDTIPVFCEDADCFIANSINGVLGEGHNVGWPMRNVWLGVSVENQDVLNKRAWTLLKTPAAVRFLSCEPLLGPLDLNAGELLCKEWRRGFTIGTYLDWVIVGGESGPGARPMNPEWARSLRDQCQEEGVSFFFKQWGEFGPCENGEVTPNPEDWDNPPETYTFQDLSKSRCAHEVVYRVGKKIAGDLLDGKRYHEFPNEERTK